MDPDVGKTGDRRQEERRRRDGLGLLPPARTPQERAYREQLNKVAGLLLVLFGASIVGSSARSMLHGSVVALIGVALGLVALGRGIYLIARQERRRQAGRRKIRSRGNE